MSYKEVVQKIIDLESKIETAKQRQTEADRRIKEAEGYLENLSEEFKRVVFEGTEGGIKKIETEVSKFQISLKRDKVLVEALREELEKLTRETEETIRTKNQIFSELAGKWLNKALQDYDKIVDSLHAAVNKLVACASLMREVGALPTYMEAIGEDVAKILPTIKIPMIKGFELSKYRDMPFVHPSNQLKETVKREITEGR